MNIDLDKNIENYDLVFLDLETTGLDVVTGDAICEIGAFKIKQRKIIDKFHSLINPGRPVPETAYRVHKISDQELKDAPSFSAVVDDLLKFLKDSVLCAYNVEFDLGFLNHGLRAIDHPDLDGPTLDVLPMARDALSLPRYNLGTVARSLEIDLASGMHRAMDDARITYETFLKLVDIFKEKQIEKLEDYLCLYSGNNQIFKENQNQKIAFLKEAIDKNLKLEVKYFSSQKSLEQETIQPLRVFQEGRFYYLLYQSKLENALRIRLRYLLDIKLPLKRV